MNLSNELRKDLRTPGAITQLALNKKGVKSPNTDSKIEIARGFWVVPREPLKTAKEVKQFIEKQRLKFKL